MPGTRPGRIPANTVGFCVGLYHVCVVFVVCCQGRVVAGLVLVVCLDLVVGGGGCGRGGGGVGLGGGGVGFGGGGGGLGGGGVGLGGGGAGFGGGGVGFGGCGAGFGGGGVGLGGGGGGLELLLGRH